ncbi:MAG: PAS domain-containing protein [Rickettsiaceae bacterium]|nr:PAS domain-containing protein [Rickettsiaceae bacterium]
MNTKPENEVLITRFEYLKNFPGHVVVKDVNSNYQVISKDFSSDFGWKTVNEVIGKTDYDIPCKASELAESFRNIDRKVIKYNITGITIEAFYAVSSLMVVLVNKKPIYDKKGEIIGLICILTDITNLTVKNYVELNDLDKKVVAGFKPKQYVLTPEFSPLSLSRRQQECLSLLIRGKTAKEIAYVLGISFRTVEIHLQITKHKLGCNSKSQLIEKAIDSGFLFHVPDTIFGQI